MMTDMTNIETIVINPYKGIGSDQSDSCGGDNRHGGCQGNDGECEGCIYGGGWSIGLLWQFNSI